MAKTRLITEIIRVSRNPFKRTPACQPSAVLLKKNFGISSSCQLHNLNFYCPDKSVVFFFLKCRTYPQQDSHTTIYIFIIFPYLGWINFGLVLCLSFFEGAYSSEIIRGGIQAIKKGQYLLGLNTSFFESNFTSSY